MILLAIGFCAEVPDERYLVLERSLESARVAGEGVARVVVVTGNADRVRELARRSLGGGGIPVIEIPVNPGIQQGEAAIGRAAIEHAKTLGAQWLVKAAGDTFHPMPSWAQNLVRLAERQKASLVATAHHKSGRVNTQVWAARTGLADATFPRPQDPALETQGLEPTWGDRLRRSRLDNLWFAPDSRKLVEGSCVNFAPREPEVAYLHSHEWAVASRWSVTRGPEASALGNGGFSRQSLGDGGPSLSIVIPARNEIGKDKQGRLLLPSTIESIAETSQGFAAPEIIIVDDGSDQTLPITRPRGLPLRVFRNPRPLGVDPSRNLGVAASHGDVVGILDGHMRVQTQEGVAIPGGLQRLAALAVERQAIVVGRCAHLELPDKKNNDYPLCAASFVRITKPTHVLGAGWNHFHPPEGVRRVNAMLGASYFFPRNIWQKLGGFCDCCRIWGFSEEGMSLKAAFLGIPILYCGDVTVSHWFRAGGPHPFTVDGFEKWINCAKVLRLAFEEETFREFWLPRCKNLPRIHAAGGWKERHDAAINDEALTREAARFRAQKILSDAEVMFDLFGVEL